MSRASKAPGARLGTRRRTGIPHSKWCGHLKPHLDYRCFMRKGLEFAPQQLPGIQSQLGGLVGLVRGRWKIRWKIARVELELWDLRPWARTQPLHHTVTTHPHTYHTFTHIPHNRYQTVCSTLVRNEKKQPYWLIIFCSS